MVYRDHADLESQHAADLQMIQELQSIPNPTFREKLERAIVIRLLRATMKLGMGTQMSFVAHLLKVKVFDKDEIWSADLVELRSEPQFKHILTVIDLYIKYAWAIPLPNKKGQTVADAFKRIMNESGRKPKKVWVDKGTELYNQYVKALPFEIYSTLNDGKAVVVERFNRTLKQMLFKKFTFQGHKKWLKLLPEIIDKYNNKVHSTI